MRNKIIWQIYGEKTSKAYPKQVAHLNALARNGTNIYGVLQLNVDGFLGDGGIGFVYEGLLVTMNPLKRQYILSTYKRIRLKMFKENI